VKLTTLLILLFIFTNLIGYFILKIKRKKFSDPNSIIHFFCEECGLEFTEDENHCPFCLKEGIQSKLIPRKMKPL